MFQAEAQTDVSVGRKTGPQVYKRLYKAQVVRYMGRDPAFYFRADRVTLIVGEILSRTDFGAEIIRGIAPPTFDRDDVDPAHVRLRQGGERTGQKQARFIVISDRRGNIGYGNGISSSQVHVIALVRDRQNTRLNSSHQIISYAVLSLNKNI